MARSSNAAVKTALLVIYSLGLSLGLRLTLSQQTIMTAFSFKLSIC
jgi:hypothetical protein